MNYAKLVFLLIFSIFSLGCNDSGGGAAKSEQQTVPTSADVRVKKIGNMLFIPENQNIKNYSKPSVENNILVVSSVSKHIDVSVKDSENNFRFMNLEPINYITPRAMAIQKGKGSSYCFTSYDSNSKLPLTKSSAVCSFIKPKATASRSNKIDVMVFVQDPSKSSFFTRIATSQNFEGGKLSLVIQNARKNQRPVIIIGRCENGTSRGELVIGSVGKPSDLKSTVITCKSGDLRSLNIGGEIIQPEDLPKENGFIFLI